MRPDDPYAPPKNVETSPPRGDRKPFGPFDYFWLFFPGIMCVIITVVPIMLHWIIGPYPMITTGLIGIGVGAILCLVTGVRFGERMKTGGPFVSSVVWIIIVTAVNSALAWGGCAVVLSAM